VPEVQEEEAERYLAVIRSMIQHEDTLLNQRLTWMWTLQGLLFGAAAFLWKEGLLPVAVVSAVGLLSAVSIGYSLNRGLRAVKDLLTIASDYKNRLSIQYEFAPTIGSRRKAIEWLLPGRFLSWLFGVSWLIIVALRLALD